jgi:hypothetical protein
MKQGHLTLSDPESTLALDQYRGGIRQLTLVKLLFLGNVWRNEYRDQGDRWHEFLRTKPEYVTPDWMNFLMDMKATDAAKILAINERSGWEYATALQKLFVLIT